MPILPAFAAKKGVDVAQSFTQPLFADLLVVKTQLKLSKRSPPVEIEAHVNPIGIGVGLVGVGLALWLTQQRLSPSTETKVVGHFEWPDGTGKSPQYIEGEFAAPTRTIPAVTHEEEFTIDVPIHKGDEVYWHKVVRTRTVEDTPARTEIAVWIREGEKTVRSFKLKERKGFLGSGVGTETDSTAVVAKALTGMGWVDILSAAFGGGTAEEFAKLVVV